MNTRSYRRSLLGKCALAGMLACSAALADAAPPPPPPLEPAYGPGIWFGPHRTYQAADSGGSVAIADVTGDGRNDVVMTASSGARDARLVVFRQLPNRSLADAVSYRYEGPPNGYYGDLDVGDLNKDGTADVAVTGLNRIHVYYGRSGRLRGPAGIAYRGRAGQIVFRDMNLDGRLDFVVGAVHSDATRTGVFVMTRSRRGFATRRIHPYLLFELEVGDVNGDRRPDVVGLGYPNAHANTGATMVVVCAQRAGGVFRCRYVDPRQEHGEGPNGLEVADVTGDGRADVAITAGGNFPRGRLILFRQTARGGLAPPVRRFAMDIPHAVEAGDVDGDRRMDLVVGHRAFPYLGTFVQKRDRTLDHEGVHANVSGYYGPKGLAVGDINGDRRVDVAIASQGHLYVLPHMTRGPGGVSLGLVNLSQRPRLPEAGRAYEVRMVVSRRWAALTDRSNLRVGCAATLDGRAFPAATRLAGRTVVVCRWNVPASARGKPLSGSISARWRGEAVTWPHGGTVG